MIFVGYQGIGKSTLAGHSRFIDLESGNFWVNGIRDGNWYKVYAKIAMELSKQGFYVMTASHGVVREELLRLAKTDEFINEKVYVVHPAIQLKDEWIKKLYHRHLQSQLEKDYKAWKNAKEQFEQNIHDLINSPFTSIVLEDMQYDLEEILDNIVSPIQDEIDFSYTVINKRN